MMLDIDHFKKYNDHYGHGMGDKVISKIGRILSELHQGEDDCAFRLGGEEFGCIGSSESIDGVKKMAERVRMGVESLNIEHYQNPPSRWVTVSVGVRIVLDTDSRDKKRDLQSGGRRSL